MSSKAERRQRAMSPQITEAGSQALGGVGSGCVSRGICLKLAYTALEIHARNHPCRAPQLETTVCAPGSLGSPSHRS